MRADGYVIIDTKIREDGMEQGFQRLKTDMGAIANDAEKMGKRINDIFHQIDASSPIASAQRKVQSLAAQLEATTAEFKISISEDDDGSAQRLEKRMTSLYDRLEAAREKLAREVAKAAEKQAKEEEKAAEKARKAVEQDSKAKKKAMDAAYRDATKGARHFGSRFREILSGALIFNLISSGLRTMTSYFGDALKTNEQYRQSVARLKGALLTAFQPIYEYVVPAVVHFINLLTVAAQKVSKFFATLTGKSTSSMAKNAEEMYKTVNNVNEAGKAAGDASKNVENVGKEAKKTGREIKKASRELMGFDQLNKLSEKDSGTFEDYEVPEIDEPKIEEIKVDLSDSIKPIFESIEEWDLSESDITEWLNKILELVGAVGAALLGWKIGSYFFDELAKISGLAAGLAGAFIYAYNWIDALVNGITWNNFGGMLVGIGVAVAGFTLAFGPLGAAITLLVGGIGMAIVAMREWITTGELSNEACSLLVAGIMAIGAAFTIFTTNWIPLLIAAIVSLLAIVAKNADKIKDTLNKFGEWLKKVFCKDWQEVFGVTLGTAMNALVDIAGGVFRGLKDILFGFLDILTGIFTFNWEKIWNGLGSVVKGAVNGIIGVLNGMISAVTGAINLLMKILWGGANAVQKILGRQTYSIPQISPPKIPYLAQGAVIPPNAPFLAMLGDQRNGNNIEAPEELIRKIVREEAGANAETMAVLRAILSAVQASGNNKIVINGRDVFQTVVDENNRATRIYGASPLKV